MQPFAVAGIRRDLRAAFIERYGGPEVVQVGDQPAPGIGPGELLVEVKAASVNPVDFKLRDGQLKALTPHRFPLVLGNDLSGVVRAVGAGVTRFRVGDEVHARIDKRRLDAFAELAVVAEQHAARKPRKLTHEEAASIPLAGLTAWQAFTDIEHRARAAFACSPSNSPRRSAPTWPPPPARRTTRWSRSWGPTRPSTTRARTLPRG